MEKQPSQRTATGSFPIWIIVALVGVLSPFVKRAFDRVPEPVPQATAMVSPEDCIRYIFKANGVDQFSTNKGRVLNRIAVMDCDELSSMIQYARQYQEKFKTLTPLETQNANLVGEALKSRLSVAGCQATADGSYVEPPTESVGK